MLIGGGGSDEAGFVHVLQIDDPGDEPLPQAARVIEPLLRRHRPDIIGELLARADDGAATEVVYFTSEEEARAHEAEELPEDAAAAFRDLWGGAFARARFLDLRSPVLVTPA